MKKSIWLSFILFLTLQAIGQGESNIWYFGKNAGIDFNGGSPPVSLGNGALNANEGCSTICDKNGNLLFYTDGVKVWDRYHTQMPNGAGLIGHTSTTQSAMIVPKPGDRNRYYIFTVGSHDQYPNNRFAIPFGYSEVDMTLNGGFGDVIAATKNTVLFMASTEKVTAIRHISGAYIWVIGQEQSGSYRAYLIDCKGINAPVVSNVGHPTLTSGIGCLVGSPNNKRLASAMASYGNFIMDFDNATGIVSNVIALGATSTANFAYGICFSPDSKLVYAESPIDGNIIQFNLQAGSASAIVTSSLLIGVARGTGGIYKGAGMRLGPDKKLYVTQYNEPYLSVINDPNVIGLGCNFQTNAINLQGRISMLGLPGFMQPYLDDTIAHVGHCSGLPTSFSLVGVLNNADSVRWHFGDPASGTANTSASFAPDHIFNSAGSFQVRAIKYFACLADTLYATVKIYTTPFVNLGADTVICSDTLTLKSLNSYANVAYQWSRGDTTQMIGVKQSGSYWLLATSQNGCTSRDTINVELKSKLDIDLGNDTTICDAIPLVLKSSQPAGTQYIWSTGEIADNILVTQGGKYWLYAYWNGCKGSDTINVEAISMPVVYAGPDTTICEGKTLKIGALVEDATYQWSNGSTTPYITVTEAGAYILIVANSACIASDTVNITMAPVPVVSLGNDTSVCFNQSVILQCGNPGSSYIWNTASTNERDTIARAGTYWVTVISQYKCKGSDTIRIKHLPVPTLDLGNDTAICEEGSFVLTPHYINNSELLNWSDGSIGDQLLIAHPGLYYAVASNQCGSAMDTINVHHASCNVGLPNVFTPNGDNKNDKLRLVGILEKVANFELIIYNRWGEMVFKTNDKYKGWDGTYNGSDCRMDTYLYMMKYDFGGQAVMEKGDVTLIR